MSLDNRNGLRADLAVDGGPRLELHLLPKRRRRYNVALEILVKRKISWGRDSVP